MLRLGIDIGGTKLEAALIAADGLVMARKRIPTEAHFGCEHIIKRVGELAKELLGETSNYTVGVGSPGSISPRTGLLRNSNTVCLNDQPLKDLIEKELNHPIVIENDANCFALAESILGAGQNYKNVFGLILGTGCGGGVILNGKRLLGANLIAGEWGHHSIDINGKECWCGNKGCLENYISGSGMEKQYEEQTGEKLSAKEIFFSQTKIAIEIKKKFYDSYGRGIANICNILDPDIIVVGGGLSNEATLYSLGLDSVRKYIFSDQLKTKIVRNSLGDSAGVLGAAMLTENLVF
jgi:fructokinase